MPMKFNVGMHRKVGQPNYSSLGASCNVEVELSGSLVFDDPNAFQQHVREVYAACERAVDEQLGTMQKLNGSSNGDAHAEPPARHNGDTDVGQHNGNGAAARQVTEKQLGYIRQLAGQINGLGVRKLESLSQNMFGKPVAGLTSLDASGMIDYLKGIKEAEVDLQAAIKGVAT
jgi:hypothetical protein